MRNCVVTLCLLFGVYLTLHRGGCACYNQTITENLKCFVNFIDNVSCTWYRKSHQGDGPFLLILEGRERQCTLLKMPHDENTFSCNITDVLAEENDWYDLLVQDVTTNQILDKMKDFYVSCNIKLDPPTNVTYKINGTTYAIMWMENEKYIGYPNLQYQLQRKKATSSWEEAKLKIFYDKRGSGQSDVLLSSEFETGSDYDLRLRCKPQDYKYYDSQWSEWSSELRIPALGAEDESKVNILYIIMVVCPLATTCILLYLVFCSSLCGRLKMPFLKEVPTAANFFKPLYIVHDGNFQDWTKYPNKCVQRKREGRSCNSMDSVHRVFTILCVQETISPVKVEPSTPTNDVHVTEEACDITAWPSLFQNKEISVNEVYPSFSPDFSLLHEEEEQNVTGVDCPTVYFSYNGTYFVNSVETEG